MLCYVTLYISVAISFITLIETKLNVYTKYTQRLLDVGVCIQLYCLRWWIPFLSNFMYQSYLCSAHHCCEKKKIHLKVAVCAQWLVKRYIQFDWGVWYALYLIWYFAKDQHLQHAMTLDKWFIIGVDFWVLLLLLLFSITSETTHEFLHIKSTSYMCIRTQFFIFAHNFRRICKSHSSINV